MQLNIDVKYVHCTLYIHSQKHPFIAARKFYKPVRFIRIIRDAFKKKTAKRMTSCKKGGGVESESFFLAFLKE